jgi:hypothetical protein
MPSLNHARWLIGSLLIAAAFSKSLNDADSVRFLYSETLNLAAILTELGLAAACVSGVSPRATRMALSAIFSCFLLTSLYFCIVRCRVVRFLWIAKDQPLVDDGTRCYGAGLTRFLEA